MAILVVVMTLAACAARRVSLAELADHQGQYAGQTVTTSGTVRHFTDGGGYDVLEDAAGNRVLLRPESAVADRVGDRITVTGGFALDPSVGRVLSVASVSVSAP